jgi:acylphosphatase
MATSTHSITITGKVQDIGFRNTIEHIGRSFGLPGMVFNAKDGSVKILCSGEDTVIDNFTQEIKVRGMENGAEIAGIKEQTLSIYIELPDNFTKVSSDDDIDIGRKMDVGVEVLRNIKGDTSALVIEMREHNKEQRGHNTRLEAILEKLAEK